jgi:quercetin dioxygenase-like cupin family protein
MSVTALPGIVVTKSGEGRLVRFFADTIEIKAEGGDVDVFEIEAHAGGEPPLHVHERESESFFVLEGAVTFYAGDAVVRGEAGTYVSLPRGLAHTYSVDSGVARLVVTATPGGFLEMFDAVVAEFDGATPEALTPEDGQRLGGTLARFGITIVGPNPGAV